MKRDSTAALRALAGLVLLFDLCCFRVAGPRTVKARSQGADRWIYVSSVGLGLPNVMADLKGHGIDFGVDTGFVNAVLVRSFDQGSSLVRTSPR
jgi:hypothetical protein